VGRSSNAESKVQILKLNIAAVIAEIHYLTLKMKLQVTNLKLKHLRMELFFIRNPRSIRLFATQMAQLITLQLWKTINRTYPLQKADSDTFLSKDT
jgi:hypothetical protein